MDSNTYSTPPPERQDDLAALTAVVDELAGRDLDGLSEMVRAEQVLTLRQLLDRLEATGAKNSPPSTPAGPPGPSSTSSQDRPPAGCGTASG